MRYAVNAAIIQQDKLLLTRKGKTWILPGGKPQESESDLTCLIREVKEELSDTKIKNFKYYGDFIGTTPHKRDDLIAKVYFADIDGELYGVRQGDTILEIKWVDDFDNYNISNITQKIITSLKQDKYLK